MKWIKKIDLLLMFLMLSVLFLYAFVGDIDYFFKKENSVVYKTFKSANNTYSMPKQGKFNKPLKLTVFNPKYVLKISTNGGKDWVTYNAQDLSKIKINDITKYSTSIRYKFPSGKQPSIISFLVKANHQNKPIFVEPKQLTYIKNYQSKLPIVSLIINQDDLFDTFKGIFVLGKHSWVEKDNQFYKKYWDRNANYKQRAGEWYKKAYFQYFEEQELKSELICDVAVSGNATRAFSQKSLKLKSNKIYGKQKFKYKYFGKKGLSKYKSILLRQSGNDNKKTLFADLLMQSLVVNNNVLTQQGKPVNVFINGNYWGVYNLRERYEKYLIAKKEKVKPSEITILEGSGGLLKKGSVKEQLDYISFIDSVFNLNEISNQTIIKIDNKINLNSFMDYIFYETFYGNRDWLTSNNMWYKAGNKKWKWVLNDLDYALAYLGIENVKDNYFNLLYQSNSYTAKLFKVLIKNDDFKTKFKAVLQDDLIKMYQNNRVESTFNKLKNNLEKDIIWQTNRWRSNFTLSEWEKNCQANLSFLKNRKTIYKQQIDEL
jgi:hypothetical protein